jgi:hypothetical protein
LNLIGLVEGRGLGTSDAARVPQPLHRMAHQNEENTQPCSSSTMLEEPAVAPADATQHMQEAAGNQAVSPNIVNGIGDSATALDTEATPATLGPVVSPQPGSAAVAKVRQILQRP